SIKDDDIPYITEYPNKIPKKIQKIMNRNNLKYRILSKLLSYKFKLKSSKHVNDLDQILLKSLAGQSYGGF
ncbi:hypothetical protein LCGC14_2375450, partial [marine sediment metagenome]